MATAEGINWSFSKLMMYEGCALRFKLKYIDRLPEPPQPENSPLERGSRIHDHLEKFVKGDTPSLKGIEAKQIDAFEKPLEHLRVLYSDGMAIAEDDWWFDTDWTPCEKPNVWLWSKLDFNVHDEANGLTIVGDYKSGKSAYKALEHVQQVQLYGAVAALRQEWAETIVAELWYVDEGWVRSNTFTREQALKFVGRFNQRVERMYGDRFFRPNANKITCKWCPYSPRGTGACPVGV